MTTRPQLLSQSGLSPELTGQFERDWSAANDSYNAAVSSGNPSQFADSLYLDPIRKKWSIVASSPQLVQDKDQFTKFNKDFNAANDIFQKSFIGGDNVSDAANQPDSLVPTLKKWSVESVLPADTASTTSQKIAAAKWPQQDIDEFRQLQEAARQFKLEAYKKSSADTDSSGNIMGPNENLIAESKKYSDAAESIREKNKDLGKISDTSGEDIPTADTPDAVSALPYGSKYWSGGHLFQSFSPTKGRGTITVGGQVVSSPAQPETSAPPVVFGGNQTGTTAFNPDVSPTPDQSPATAGILNGGWRFSPQSASGHSDVVPAAAPAADDIPMIQSQSQYDSLPVGAKYKDSSGKLAIKRKR